MHGIFKYFYKYQLRYPILDFLKVKYHKKEKEKEKINHFTAHTLNTDYYLNIYNLLNNIKFAKEKKN